MSKIVKIIRKESAKSGNAIDNRIFQHRNQHISIHTEYAVKLMWAVINCRTNEERKRFFDRRDEFAKFNKDLLI